MDLEKTKNNELKKSSHYENKIRELQDSICGLRMSRRILMSLLESLEDERREEKRHLSEESLRLQKTNSNFAHLLWEKNKRIYELESRLKERKSF
ncbi:MAG: translation initiation factor 2 [Clostridiales bacterium]